MTYKKEHKCRTSWQAAVEFVQENPLTEDEKKALRATVESLFANRYGRFSPMQQEAWGVELEPEPPEPDEPDSKS